MSEPSQLATRLLNAAFVAADFEALAQHREVVKWTPQMIWAARLALDDAGLREAVDWLEEAALSDGDGAKDCARRALANLQGTKDP